MYLYVEAYANVRYMLLQIDRDTRQIDRQIGVHVYVATVMNRSTEAKIFWLSLFQFLRPKYAISKMRVMDTDVLLLHIQ